MATVPQPAPRPRRALTADADGKIWARGPLAEHVHADGRAYWTVAPVDPPSPLTRLAASLTRLGERGVLSSSRRPSGRVRVAPCGCCHEPADEPPDDLAGPPPGFERR